MRVTLLLADFAQVVDGKLYILGGGWSMIGPNPSPLAVAIKVEVPWTESNRRHQWRLDLLDADGRPVAGPDGKPVAVSGGFEVGRPAGLREGSPLDVALAINFPPFPLPPDSRLVWQLGIDGETRDDWRASFTTRPSR